MLIIKGDVDKFKKSEFYDNDCWDYPRNEVEMLKEDENYSDIVYFLAEDRIYETNCDMHNLSKIMKEVDGEIYHITSKQEKELLEEVVSIFNEQNDNKALKMLYDFSKDKLIKIVIELNEEFKEEIEDYTSNLGKIYEDLIEYIYDKYDLNEVGKNIEENKTDEQEEEGEI